MDPVKEAFSKIKEDIYETKEDIVALRTELKVISKALLELHDKIQTIQVNNPSLNIQQTDQQVVQQTTQTHNLPLESLRSEYINTSIGNEGVQTNSQTDTQTDQHPLISTGKPIKSDFERASDALESLDSIKKEIRLKFKRLTSQEMLVFSTIYSLEGQNMSEISYKMVADSLNLSESSIRDYINKLIKKGVPILKIRQNNKKILLSIDQNLKNIATLETISRLRDL